MLLINLTLSHDPAERSRLLWWLRTIQVCGRDRQGRIQVLLVGTHADQIEAADAGEVTWQYLADCGHKWQAFGSDAQVTVERQFQEWRTHGQRQSSDGGNSKGSTGAQPFE